MEKKPSLMLNRRTFIRQAACAAVGTAAMTSAIRDLRVMTAAAQSGINPNDPNDYKALICIFLAGGNDANNLIIPPSASDYTFYQNARTPVLAIPQANLLATALSPANNDGHSYALHPACTALSTLFGQTAANQTKLAVLFNTGVLSYPLTKSQYNGTPSKRPPQLFSHADQVTQWQTSVPDQPALTGWGGRCADIVNSVLPSAPISLNVSLAGANTFEVGNNVSQYAVSTSGAIALSGVSGARLGALTNVLGLNYSNLQAQAYAGVAKHSINSGQTLNATIGDTTYGTPDPSGTVQFWNAAPYNVAPYNKPFPGSGTFQLTNPLSGVKFNSGLGPQLKMIARLIEAGHRSASAPQNGFGMKRQIFFCSVGGYDLHSGQTDYSSGNPNGVITGAHSNLLYELSQCMTLFRLPCWS